MAEGDLRWKYNVGKAMRGGVIVDSNGVIYAGTLYAGSEAKIIAINPDGSLKWEYNLRGSAYSGLALSNDESALYVGDLHPYLYAIYTATGNLKWEYTDVAINNIYSGIAVDSSDNIYFGTRFGPTLKSLDYSGNLRWNTADNNKENYSQITIKNTSILYCVTGDGLSQVQLSDGTIDWTYPAGGQGTGVSIASDGTIYYGGGWDYEYAINSDGTLKWRYGPNYDSSSANAIGSNNKIWFIGGYPPNLKLVCLNTDGSLSWNYSIPDWTGEGTDTTGLGVDGNDISYVGCRNNNLYAINSDGSLRWTYTADNQIRSAIKFSPSEDTVYFGCNDGYLYAIEKEACGKIAVGDKVFLLPIGNFAGNMVALKSGSASTTDKALIAPLDEQAVRKLAFRNCKSSVNDKVVCTPIGNSKKDILAVR